MIDVAQWTAPSGVLPREFTGASSLSDAARQMDPDLLPTPTAGDSCNTRNITSRSGEGRKGEIGYTMSDVAHVERWGHYADAVTRHASVTGIAPPDPTDHKRRLSPAFVEWMMMLPPGWVTDLDLSRTAQLRILGNGVVPPQAAAAYTELLR